jgi:hypothetical protein
MTRKGYGSISAIVVAVLLVSGLTIMPSSSEVVAKAPIHAGKGDRLDYRPLGTQSSEQAWPHFEAGCMRDLRAAGGTAKHARIVSADRVSLAR